MPTGQSDPDSSSLRICYSQSYVIKNMNKRLLVGRLDFWQWCIGRLDGKNSETVRVVAAVALLLNYVNHSMPLLGAWDIHSQPLALFLFSKLVALSFSSICVHCVRKHKKNNFLKI